jgi:hypothetical protein
MAVRNDFTAGEVLAAADLNDTFASKLAYSYGTAEPTTTIDGFVWFDENTTPPTPKYWDGSAFQTFSAGPADFSDAATGTYTDTGISYKYITFTASGTLTVTKAGFADVLLIGGGGAGARNSAGGGGGGGHLYATDVYLPASTLTVTVGAGGANQGASPAPGQNGRASRLGNYFSPGGGAGGFDVGSGASQGINGGSGGGGAASTNGGAGESGLGNAGSNGSGGNAGGGGGAGSTSGNNNGGAGLANSITGSSVTRAGGGAAFTGTGGTGGGGNPSTDGTANTGGGGGGWSGSGTQGNGGSGVVIVRVKV